MAIIPNLSPLNRADVRQNVVANTGLETVKASAHPSTLRDSLHSPYSPQQRFAFKGDLLIFK